MLVRAQFFHHAHHAYAEGHEPGDEADEEDARERFLVIADIW